jgi:hypothetical protein
MRAVVASAETDEAVDPRISISERSAARSAGGLM